MNKRDLQNLIASGRLNQFFDKLKEIFNGKMPNDFVNLKSRLSRLKKKESGGLISYANATLESNQITNSAVSFLSDLELPETTSTTSNNDHQPTNNRIPMQALLKNLQSLEKHIRFGFTAEFKEKVKGLKGKVVAYIAAKSTDETYDADEAILEQIQEDYVILIEAHQRVLRTKRQTQIAAVKKKLAALENDMKKEYAAILASALVGFDTKHQYLVTAVESVATDGDLENLCMQMAGIVDRLK